MSNRMFRIAIALLFLFAPFLSQAAPVEKRAAEAAATAFLREVHGEAGIARCVEVDLEQGLLAYVFVLAPTGYVAVAGDDALPPVIAYSLESDYPVEGNRENPLARMLAADLKNRLAALSPGEAGRRTWSQWFATFPRDGRFTQWPPAGSTVTGGWLATNWTQNAPYNAHCPLDLAHSGTRSLAGCPAVAMAMILNFHETIQETSFDPGDRYWHNYAGNAYWIPDAAAQYGFPNFSTLNGYLQTLTQHWSQGAPLTSTDKAALTFGCGIAARQVYSASGSGTFGVDQAYAAYQRFAFDTCRLVFDTDPQMYPDLAEQMRNALPAHLAVVDPGWTMGHNVVVDGYNTDNYYHLNFGWGGSYNGWYLLPQEIPYGLTVIEGVILDIVPSISALAEHPVARAALQFAPAPNPFSARVTLSFQAPSAGHARLRVYDVSGRLLTSLLDGDVAAGPRSITWTPGTTAAGTYLARLELDGQVETRRMVVIR